MTDVKGTDENGERGRNEDRISEQAAQKVINRIAWFLFVNAGALIGAMGTGIGAYFSLDARGKGLEAQVTINTRRIDRMLDSDDAQRLQLEGLISEFRREMRNDVNEMRRDHTAIEQRQQEQQRTRK